MSEHTCPECGDTFPDSSSALDGTIAHDCLGFMTISPDRYPFNELRGKEYRGLLATRYHKPGSVRCRRCGQYHEPNAYCSCWTREEIDADQAFITRNLYQPDVKPPKPTDVAREQLAALFASMGRITQPSSSYQEGYNDALDTAESAVASFLAKYRLSNPGKCWYKSGHDIELDQTECCGHPLIPYDEESVR